MRRTLLVLAASLALAGGGALGDDEKKTDTKPEAKGHDFPELETYKHNIIIVLDRSGSMAIADRFKAALDQVDKILNELPSSLEFGVYVFDTKPVSVFDSNNVKAKDPKRARLRKRIEELGGVDLSAFTDLSASLAPAIRARPDAIYLLSDGVPTKGALASEGILKSIKDLMPTKKFPVHVVAIRGGKYEDGLEENDEAARAILKAVAEATGGKYREVEAKEASGPALKPKQKDGEQAELHFFHANEEFKTRELTFPHFEVQVRDLAFAHAVLEYADVSLDVKTKTDAGVVFDEVKGIDISFRTPDEAKQGLDKKEKTFWSPPIKVVRPQDSREGEQGTVFVKIPSSGGTLEVTYRRGKKEFPKVFSIKAPVTPPPTGK